MANYLIRQLANGRPVGVITEDDSAFVPQVAEEYVRDSLELAYQYDDERFTWDEWVDALADRSPTVRGAWAVLVHRNASPEYVLKVALSDWE